MEVSSLLPELAMVDEEVDLESTQDTVDTQIPLTRCKDERGFRSISSHIATFQKQDAWMRNHLLARNNVSPDEQRAYRLKRQQRRLNTANPPIVEGNLNICGYKCSKERVAWYSYDAAMSPITGFVISFLIPIVLVSASEHYAITKAGGILCSDIAPGCVLKCGASVPSSCAFHHSVNGSVCNISTPCSVLGQKLWDESDDRWGLVNDMKTVPFLGIDINVVAYPMVIVAASTVMQGFVIILYGPFADYGSHRKHLLLSCACLGSIVTSLFITVSDDGYIALGVFTVLVHIFLGLSIVAHNAYLPVLIDANHVLRRPTDDLSEKEKHELDTFRDLHGTDMSSSSYIYGYIFQVVAMIIGSCIILLPTRWPKGDKVDNLRIAIMCMAFWWMFWSAPVLFWLKPRPAPPIPKDTQRAWAFGWQRVWKTLCLAWKYQNTFRFLMIFFFVSDMIATITYLGIIVAKSEMHLSLLEVVLLILLTTIMSIVGSSGAQYVKRRWKVSSMGIVEAILGVYGLLCAWGCVGLFSETVGLRTKTEAFLFAAIHGFCVGPLQSFWRILYAELIPIEFESSFFSLYEIFAKCSSWIGPIVFSIVSNSGLEVRIGCAYLTCISVISILALHFGVDREQGMAEVGRLHVKTLVTEKIRARETTAAKEKSTWCYEREV